MGRRKWWIAAALLVVLIVGGVIAYDQYFNKKPDDLANEYREEAARSARDITGTMDRVYDSFDGYLLDFTIPAKKLRNVDSIEEYRRRLLPVLADTGDGIDEARAAIKAANKAIDKGRDDLLDTPTARWLEDSEPIQETEAVARKARDYLKRAERFLGSYGEFISYSRDDLKLRRRELKIATQNEPEPDASLEELRAGVATELEEQQQLRKAREDLEPPRDLEALADNALEGTNIVIDFLEATDQGLAALDITAIDAASAELLDESKRVQNRDSTLIAKLSTDSGLSNATRSLSKRADELQDAIAEVGSEGKERDAPRRKRPPPILPPKEPPAGESGSGSDDDQVS